MKVKLKDNVSEVSLRKADEYYVLSIEVFEEKTLYRILSDWDSPSIYNCKLFDIVSHKMPSIWRIFYDDEGNYHHICPEAWAVDNFWVRYFDAEDKEVEEFNRAVKIILSGE